MLSYQHSYHAGGPADVHKHAALCLLLDHLTTKEKPFTVIDLYAGDGVYDLSTGAAQKLGEFKSGISRVWPGHDSPPELHRYFEAVRRLNESDTLNVYPGSPSFSQTFLRTNDTLTLNELHPSAYRALRHWRGSDKRIALHKRDGMEALLGLIPPQIRRGLVFIDPSYEVKTEYTEIPKKVSVGMEKWPQGIYAVWYPVLSEGRHKILTEGMAALGDTNILTSEISIAQPKDGGEDNAPRLLGSGLIVVNPPWKFDASIICAGKWLAKAMTGNSDNHTTRWLKRAEGSA